MSMEKQVIQAITEHLGLLPEDLDRQTLLREELSLGPVELNDLLDDLSKRFDVSFDERDLESLKKIEDLVALVEDNLID